jgi:hypothetical protein
LQAVTLAGVEVRLGERPRIVFELGTDGRLHETPVAPALQVVRVPVIIELPRPGLLARVLSWLRRRL